MFWNGVVIGIAVGTVVVAFARAAKDERDGELGRAAWELEREVWLRDR